MPQLDEKAINHEDLAAYHDQLMQSEMSKKADKTATVSNVSFNSSTGKLQKTVNGSTTDVCDVVNSGFRITEDDTNGIDTFTAVGQATITDDNTNGLDIMNF